jgi:SNF2 family DNA or RNA helicase
MKYEAYPYQARGVAWLLAKPYSGLIMRPGLGKTSVVLATRVILKKRRLGRRALVVAPLRVAQIVWTAENLKWEFGLKMKFAHGANFESVMRDMSLDVVTVTCDSWQKIRQLFTPKQMEKLFDHLIVDESTKFKHTGAKRSRAMKEFLPSFGRRTIMTGTPAPNGYQDLFGQILIVDRGLRLGQYITRYFLEYFDSVGYGGYTKVLKTGAAKKIEKKLGDILYFVDDEELGLPKYRINPIYIDLPEKARRQYDELKAETILEVAEGTVTAVNAAVLSGKLRQAANGGLYTSEGKSIVLHNEKTDALEDLVEEQAGDPVLVGYEFDHDLERLLKRFGKKTPFIKGGMSKKKVADILTAFDGGEMPVLLAQGGTISYGMNLQSKCRTVCWHSLLWDWELVEQFLRRVYRLGQQRHVTVHFIVGRDTLDEVVFKVLKGKDRTQRSLLTALKGYLKGEI